MEGTSTFSLTRFLVQENENGLSEDDDEDEVNERGSCVDNEEMVRTLMDQENNVESIHSHVDDSINVARSEAIQWIINMRSLLGLRYYTAYLCVMYIDRFISKGLVSSDKQWAIKLLSVACLSLAVKMKEREPRLLSSYSTEKYNFNNNVIQRMELLVLTTLDWKIRLVTPFDFIDCFISCFSNVSPKRQLMPLTTQIVIAATRGKFTNMSIMEYRSSTIAMAATLTVMDQQLTKESLEIKLKTAWVNQLFDHEDVYACYKRMLELEPVQVKPELATSSEDPHVGTKRKRLMFNETEKNPNL
ncbi:cyclin-like protein [Artemisia annua]|uniref:Cyclin-like protein n=1 Tax=Artemisia annua TaxID=35608 RepID=A0A2U1MDR0_ARTAN|nr:cyclin-like protein [Artemisia annua]